MRLEKATRLVDQQLVRVSLEAATAQLFRYLQAVK
jgi:hypothetical protein